MPSAVKLTLGGNNVEVKIHNPEEQEKAESQAPAKEKKPAKAKAATKKPAAKKAEPKKSATPRVRKPKVEKPVVVELAVEAPKPEPSKTKPNPLEKIFQAGKALAAVDVMGGIAVTNSILTNQEAVGTFTKALSEADALAIQKLSFSRSEIEVQEEWYALSLPKIEDHLKVWAEAGSEAAEGVMAVLNAIRETAKTVDAIDPLWRLYLEIVRPANNVRSYHDLTELLRELRQKNLVETFMDRNHYPAKAIVTKAGDWHKVVHLPAMEKGKTILMAETGWPFLKEAEDRAKEWAEGRRNRLDELKGSATKGFTSADAEEGKEGTLFLQAGLNRGALLQIHKTEAGIRVRISRAIGMPLRTPTDWMSWNAKQDAWPERDLFFAFEAWKKKTAPVVAKPATETPAVVDENKPKGRKKAQKAG